MTIDSLLTAYASDEVVYAITEDQVQEFMEANYDRQLTSDELSDLPIGFFEGTDVCDFINSAIRYLGFDKGEQVSAELCTGAPT